MNLEEAAKAFHEFVAVIKALRTPETGCPWDLEQNHQSLRRYLVEESDEVLDAIDRGDDPDLREELGDLLLQVVLHAQVADDRGAFSITEVVRDISEKMVRRHPHVFDSVKVSGSEEVGRNWERIKAEESRRKGRARTHGSRSDRLGNAVGDAQGYVLGQSATAARRLEIQDAHFADVSERLLDDLALRPQDRVVELGCGPGSFSRRILRRLGAGGVLVGVDRTEGLLDHARSALTDTGPARFEARTADISELGAWLDGADVVTGRAVLHHVPMAEFMLGRLRGALRPGARVGFIEPDFRTPLGRLAHLQATGRPELAPLGVWAVAINQLYQASRLSPAVGASLARTLETAGYRHVRSDWSECRSDGLMVENMLMFYDEVRARLQALDILTSEEIDEQQRLLRALPAQSLPPAWGTYRVACEA